MKDLDKESWSILLGGLWFLNWEVILALQFHVGVLGGESRDVWKVRVCECYLYKNYHDWCKHIKEPHYLQYRRFSWLVEHVLSSLYQKTRVANVESHVLCWYTTETKSTLCYSGYWIRDISYTKHYICLSSFQSNWFNVKMFMATSCNFFLSMQYCNFLCIYISCAAYKIFCQLKSTVKGLLLNLVEIST